MGEVDVIQPVAAEGAALPEPGVVFLRALGFFASVFLPFDVGLGAEQAGALFAAGDVGGHEGADVHSHAVAEVGVPADGLLGERFPTDKEVVGRLAFEDELEAGLKFLGGLQLGVTAGFLRGDGGLLSANPIAEVGEGELLQIGVGELVIIYQRAETVLETVPDVPNERAMMEERAMLLEESVAQPVLQ